MKPLMVLMVTFLISLIVLRFIHGEFEWQLAGRIAMAIMLVFTSIAHFKLVKGMVMMVPDFLPYKPVIVYLTGILEIAGAIGLLLPNTQVISAWLLILLFILMLPANINAAIQKIDHEKGTYQGKGISYLWFRVPLQIFFIAWLYWSAIDVWNLNLISNL